MIRAAASHRQTIIPANTLFLMMGTMYRRVFVVGNRSPRAGPSP